MKIAGWIFIGFGALNFFAAIMVASSGYDTTHVFSGFSMMTGTGILLLVVANRRKKEAKEKKKWEKSDENSSSSKDVTTDE